MELIIIFVFAVVLVVVIWRFTRPKSTEYGIDVVTKEVDDKYRGELIDNTSKESQVVDFGEEKLNEVLNEDINKKKLERSTEEECVNMIIKNPKDINAYLRLSVYYLQRKKWADAKEVLLEAKKIDPENDKVYNNLGVVWYKLKRYNNALTAFEKALRRNDNIAHRQMNVGLVLAALGENERAAEFFSKAVALDPEEKNYHDLLTESKSMLV